MWACISTQSIPCSSSHLQTVRLYFWIRCCMDSQMGQPQISWGPLCTFCVILIVQINNLPMGLKRSPQSFFSTFTWSNGQCMRSLYSHVAFHHRCLVFFSQRRNGEGGLWCFGVFHRLLKQCVCRYSWYRFQPGGIPHVHNQNSHRRDRQYKISVKKQTHTWIWGRLGALRACFGLVTY